MMIDLRRWVVLPAGVTVVLVLSSKYIYSFFNFMNLSAAWQTLFAVCAYIIIAIFLMALVGVIDWHEVLQLLGIKNKKVRNFKKE